MSKSILIKEKNKLSSSELIEKLGDLVSNEVNENELLLRFNDKWIWLFFENREEFIYDIEFSKKLDKEEILEFIEELRSKISYKLVDISIC